MDHEFSREQQVFQPFAASGTVQRVNWATIDKSHIRIAKVNTDYEAYWDDAKVGDLELYPDVNGDEWINNIRVNGDMQGRGIGLALLNAAVQEHGAIYAAVGMQADEELGDDDTRHLSVEGAALVSSAVRNGILQDAWCYNPAQPVEVEDDVQAPEEIEEDAPPADLSGLNLPPLPLENFTSVCVYWQRENYVDGESFTFAAVTVHATFAEPVEEMFASENRMSFNTVGEIQQAVAAHYGIGLDRVNEAEVQGLPQ